MLYSGIFHSNHIALNNNKKYKAWASQSIILSILFHILLFFKAQPHMTYQKLIIITQFTPVYYLSPMPPGEYK
jgi:uncharacterized membrane protein HdeD (DUF308 family)